MHRKPLIGLAINAAVPGAHLAIDQPRMLRLFLVWVLLLVSAIAEAKGARALLVFGTAVEKDGRPSAKLERRLTLAARLAKRDPHALVVVSGGANEGWTAEGPVMARWLTAHGIEPSRILVESNARHTGENADFSVPLLTGAGVSQVTVVTERYHLVRAKLHLRAALRERGAVGVVVDGAGADDGLRGRKRLVTMIEETKKVLRDMLLRWRAARARKQGTLGAEAG